jgi:hypothetical protein
VNAGQAPTALAGNSNPLAENHKTGTTEMS